MTGSAITTYPPLDVLKPVCDGVWIVDSGPFRIAGLIPVPVRMTVVKLQTGSMWLHSPTRWTRALQHDIESIGPIRHLVAPNPFHWSFVREWKRHCPDAITSAVEGASRRWLVRLNGPTIDHAISDTPLADWSADFALVMVRGRSLFREVAFFHHPSRTAILTDLIVNLDAKKMAAWQRPGVAAVGALGPEGKIPVYARNDYRKNRDQAAAAVARLIAMRPERAIFSHGDWFAHNGAQRLAESLSWLTQ